MIILCVNGDTVREFLLAADDLGYTNGEYVFMDVELFKFPGRYWGDHSWRRGDEADSRAKRAYEAVVQIALDRPRGINTAQFTVPLKQLSQTLYNYTYEPGEQVTTLFLSMLS